MSQSTNLSSAVLTTAAVMTFVPINDKAKAIAFYEGKLGFTLVEDQSPFALVFDLNGIMLRATFAEEFTPQQFTILGWHVPDIASAVQELEAAEVVFARYPWMQTTGPLPIWTAPRGAQIAWFNDPFGNVLSLTQF